MIFLRYLIKVSETLATMVSYTANFTLLYCIFKKTPEDLKPFSKILRQNCFVDMFFTTVIAITFFQVDTDHGEYILFLEGIFHNIPNPWAGILLDLYVFAVYFCISSYMIPFFFRYVLIVKGIRMSNWKFYLLYFVTGSLSFIVSIGVRISTIWPGFDQDDGHEFFHGISDFWKNDDGSLPIFVASHLNNPWLVLTISYAFVLIAGSYVLIAFFCIKTIKHLNAFKEQMTEKNQKLQRQLTYTLLAQAIAPLIVGGLPLGSLLLSIIFNFGIPGLGVALITTVSWVAFLNPLCALLLVGPYRDFILRRKKIWDLQGFSSRWGLSKATTHAQAITTVSSANTNINISQA